MNNEPVAWINRHGDEGWLNWDEAKGEGWNATPLYTHPHPDNLGLALSIIDQQKLEIERLKAKTLTDAEYDNIFSNGKRLGVIETEDRFRRAMALTDGEIWAIASEIEPVEIQHGVRLSNELNVLDFARAILRKASEK